jgi:hypothetical protein
LLRESRKGFIDLAEHMPGKPRTLHFAGQSNSVMAHVRDTDNTIRPLVVRVAEWRFSQGTVPELVVWPLSKEKYLQTVAGLHSANEKRPSV